MSEWLIEHAWKSTLLARADAHEIPPTHSRSVTSRNSDTRRHVLVNHRVDRGVDGVCDTVLTQNGFHFRAMPKSVRQNAILMRTSIAWLSVAKRPVSLSFFVVQT